MLECQTQQTASAGDFESVFTPESGAERRLPWMSLPEVLASGVDRCGRFRRIGVSEFPGLVLVCHMHSTRGIECAGDIVN
ncbi:hypothetical protein CH295_25830 [Rhodococcus sp. 14-2483-1-2]|nr:hypothetical protein CH295_25830 [Rhodococcus sp. 14-2483-1-2]